MTTRATFLADQATAAQREQQALLRWVVRGADTTQALAHPVVRRLIHQFMLRIASNRLGDCEHLAGATPQPAFWLPQRPDHGLCASCVDQVLGELAQRQRLACDGCRRSVAASDLVDVQVGVGAVLILGFVCPGCADLGPRSSS